LRNGLLAGGPCQVVLNWHGCGTHKKSLYGRSLIGAFRRLFQW
jgi:hypothetical protein